MSLTKKGLNIKLHLDVEVHDMPVLVIITQSTTADCTQENRLIEGIVAEQLLADREYDSNVIVIKPINKAC